MIESQSNVCLLGLFHWFENLLFGHSAHNLDRIAWLQAEHLCTTSLDVKGGIEDWVLHLKHIFVSNNIHEIVELC